MKHKTYHIARVAFGLFWLMAGLSHFIVPELVPMGDTSAAADFHVAVINSGLMDLIKGIEIAIGALLLANRLAVLTPIAMLPVNFAIAWFTLVLERGAGPNAIGVLSLAFNAILAWRWHRHYARLLSWKAGDSEPS